MNRRILMFDLALLVLLGVSMAILRLDWIAFGPLHEVSAVQPLPETLPVLPAGVNASNSGDSDWNEIPSRNPFSFDRTDIALLAPVAEAVQAGSKPVLFGTMRIGPDWVALLAPAQAATRGSRPMKIGEIVDGWTIVEILDKSVVVEANAIRETVVMNDPTAAPPRVHTTTIPSGTPISPVFTVGGPAPAASAAAARSSEPATPASPAAGNAQPAFREIQTPFGIHRQPIN